MPSCIHLASDLHLGAPSVDSSVSRERAFVSWMRQAASGEGFAKGHKATEIHLVGDIFDFWFEYGKAIPKGGARLMGAIAEITDVGVPVHFHVGNHDMWTFGYLEEELGITVHREPILRTWDGLTCYVGHGDGLGPGDKRYKWLKKVFTSSICQSAFRWVHPDWGISLARAWSLKSRQHADAPVNDLTREHLYAFAQNWLHDDAKPHVDAFVFGHRHWPLNVVIEGSSSRYVNAGDWLTHRTSVMIYNGEVDLLTHSLG